MKVIDPVCGMAIKPEKAVATITYEGQLYYFCTEACKKQFEDSPARFASYRPGP
jgi:YHS domain-containing protein